MVKLRLGTRKSALAQAQSRWVAERLTEISPDFSVELVLMTTSGDLLTTLSARREQENSGGLKALFTKELEEALRVERIDLAVHSLKDMASELPPGLRIGAFPIREDPRDAWISKKGLPFREIPVGARIATGAVRRQAQLLRARPDLTLVPMRGNVDTRLRKLEAENLDGIILAAAGLKRLGHEAAATEVLETDVLLPAVGQGCLAIEVRQADDRMDALLKALDHEPTRQAVTAERAFLRALGGSCRTPIAAYAEVRDGLLQLEGMVVSPDGKEMVYARKNASAFEAETLGQSLAQSLWVDGAQRILENFS